MEAGLSVCTVSTTLSGVNLVRALDVAFNDRWHAFSSSAAKGGSAAPIINETTELV